VHNVSQACDAQPDQINVFYDETSGDRGLRRTLRAEAAAYARRSRPRRTLRSYDRQRASRKLSAHAVILCASCPSIYCPGATRPRKACSRLTSRFRVASYCRRVDLVCVYARSYARTIVNAHHVTLARMQSPCAHHAPHCTAQALRAEAVAYATLARSPSKVFKTRPRAKGGRGVRYARKIINAHHVS
jgi:hypothetical protein